MDELLLQIFGCIIIVLALVIVWLIVSVSKHNTYYYMDSKKLSSLIGVLAHRKRYGYDEEAKFYSDTIDHLKRHIAVDKYFITHELYGRDESLGVFNCFLCRTANDSRNRSSRFYPNAANSKLNPKTNFTGLVMSYDFKVNFANQFAFFASNNGNYYRANTIDYPFLVHYNRFRKVSPNVWFFNDRRNWHPGMTRLAKNFNRLYQSDFFEDTTIFVIFDKQKLNIFISDENLKNAKGFEDSFDFETQKINEIVKFFD